MAQPTPRFPCGHPGCEGCADGDPARCDYATPLPALPAAEPAPPLALQPCPHGRRPGAWCAECASARIRQRGTRALPREAADVLGAPAPVVSTTPAPGDQGKGAA